MIIKSLKLNNFRNYSDLSVIFNEKNNIFYGLNAQGKTNLIEALVFVSTLKSFRTSKNRDIIMFDQDKFSIECVFSVKGREYHEFIDFSVNNKYKILLNGVEYKTKNKLLGLLKTVVFCPDDLFLVKDSAMTRRKFLDDSLIQFRPKYNKLLSDFNKYIKEKNHILRNLDTKPQMEVLIEDYNIKIAELFGEISFIRANFLKLLSEETNMIYSEICSNSEFFTLNYDTKIENPCVNIENNIKSVKTLLNLYYEKEKFSKSCLIGCHKDDINFFINGKLARDFASQGQIRSIVLSLKLAVRELHFKDSKVYPVLILDDILSELDNNRKKYVTKKIKNGQVLITSPFIDDMSFDGEIFNINNGEIIK